MTEKTVNYIYHLAAMVFALNCGNMVAMENNESSDTNHANTEYFLGDFFDALESSYKQNLRMDACTTSDIKAWMSDHNVRNISLGNFYNQCTDIEKLVIPYAMELSMLLIPDYQDSNFYKFNIMPLLEITDNETAVICIKNFILKYQKQNF